MKEEIYQINQKDESKELIHFMICGITFPDRSYRINRPKSRVCCIEYIEEGTGTVHIDQKSFCPSAGDSYFLQSGKTHRYYSDRKNPWKKYFINFSGRLAESLAEGYGVSEISHFEGLDLKDELLKIIELGKKENEDCTPELIALMNTIFLKMRTHARTKNASPTIEEQMRDFLNTQTTQKFKIETLCRHISRSESQTIRLFKNAYGITPYTYVLQKKLELARKLLRDTNLSIKEIADKLCFADEYYFSNVFKQKIGITPSAYRKKND